MNASCLRRGALLGALTLLLPPAVAAAGEETWLAMYAPDAGSQPVEVRQEGAPADDAPSESFLEAWGMFSDDPRAFRPLLADPREATIRVGQSYDCSGEGFSDIQFGGDVGLLRREFGGGELLTVSVRGLFTTRFATCRSSFDQLNTDYRGGLAVGYRTGPHQMEALIFHQSSHLGDEVLDFGDRERIDYSYEMLRLMYGFDVIDDLRIYGGAGIKLRGSPTEIGQQVQLQAGAEYGFTLWDERFFAAADLKLRQENDWGPSFATQLGWDLSRGGQREVIKRPRLFLEFFTGYSNMGQYWDERESAIMLAFGFDL
jgi:hypothetical protein